MGMGMGSRTGGRGVSGARAGFSLIELVIVIGTVMILIGLLMPALASAREQAVRTRNLAAIRSDMQLLTQYAADNGELYPVGWTNPVFASIVWYLPLVEAGYMDSVHDVGVLHRESEQSLVAMTFTAFEDATVFVPGANRDAETESVVAQRASDVLFPSDKGILWQFYSDARSVDEPHWCCLPTAPLLPFAFADGSAVIATYLQFVVDPAPVMALQVGIPVQSTWQGLRGRDRLNTR